MKSKFLAALVGLAFIFNSCDPKYKGLEEGIYADIITSKGVILVKLFEKEAPMTVASFITLAEGTNTKVTDSLKGKKFYDGLTFHRVVPNFVIQGGDPIGNGTGGPDYQFHDEFAKDSTNNLIHKHDRGGILSMANSGPNTNGSQFFITHKETPWLNGKHTVFGEVVLNPSREKKLKTTINDSIKLVKTLDSLRLEVVNQIQKGDKIESINIVRLGNEAKSFDAVEVFNSELEKFSKEQEEKKKKEEELKKAFQSKMEIEKAVKTDSGLQILTLKKGTGTKVTKETKNTVHYRLYLANGTFIQDSKDSGNPFVFTISDQPMIPGFVEGITSCKTGEKARFFIPYYLAYGEKGGGPFPPKSDIIFEVEVLKVEKK